MGLIVGYETIKSRAFYHINFQIEGQEFNMREGIEDPKKALEILKKLETEGYTPEVTRKICYNNTKSGYLSKFPEYETLTIERLEKIILNNESLPIHKEPIHAQNLSSY